MRNWNDDPFTKKAQTEHFLARSAYKLEEIDRKGQIFKGVRNILDLGAAPGSWTQLCLLKAPKAKILAVDIEPLKISDPRVHFIKDDIANIDWE